MTFKFNWKSVIPLIILCILALCMLECIVFPASADDSSSGISFSYGPNYNYSVNVLPNKSYVHQGENISQGNYYDLSGIYGFSGVLAWWKDPWAAGTTYPDKTFDLNLLKLHSVYIDPATWPIGRYYQFDGALSGSKESGSSYFGNGNSYVFYVTAPSANWAAPNVTNDATPVPTATIGGQYTIITQMPTQQPTTANVVDKYGNPVNNAPAGIQEVTAKSPVPFGIVIAGLIGGLLLLRNRR